MKKWPAFSEKEIIVGDPESSVAICTLWSPREYFAKKYLGDLMNRVAVVGNLYSVYGIGILIRNCIANPNIRKLVVSGTELGVALSTLKRISGLDPSLAKAFFLEIKHLERFNYQVEIVYLAPEKIAGWIANNHDNQKSHFESLIVSLPEPKATAFPAVQSGHLIRVPSIKEGYTALLKEIRLFGHITGQDSEGHRRQELWELNMVITSQDPLDFDSIPHPEYDASHIREYCEAFWEGTEPNDLAYRYGHIIRFGFGDQVEAVVKAFKDKAETFRTVISLWDPRVDGGSITANDPPCLTLIHPRIIGEYLHLWAYIRTNDMFGGWPLNAMALRYFQGRILDRLKNDLNRPGLQLGEIGVTSGSAHIYERDWTRIDAMLAEQRPGKFSPDPKGNFEIGAENGEVVVRHFSSNGDKLLQIFRGISAEKMSKEIMPFISDIGNALYVGRALKEAELSINKGG